MGIEYLLSQPWFNAWVRYYINRQIDESRWYRE